MNVLRNMSLQASVAIFVGMAAAVSLALGALSIQDMFASEKTAGQVLVGLKSEHIASDGDMMHDALRADVLAAQMAGATAPETQKRAMREDVAAHAKRFQEAMHALATDESNPETVRRQGQALQEVVATYTGDAQQIVNGAFTDKADEAQRERFEHTFAELEHRMDQLGDQIEAATMHNLAEQEHHFATARWILVGSTAVSTVVIVLFGMAFARATLARLGAEPKALLDLSSRIAQGDLQEDPLRPPDHSVAHAMRQMRANLADVVHGIRSGAESLSAETHLLAQGNQDLSQRTEAQASTLQETAASMEQLNASVKHNAAHVAHANELAQQASSVAVDGGAAVSNVVGTMKDIHNSARQIVEIISVIDGIAFQTNILALNAAVEAARAGEQGRGFAVVANEVRGLARRSADAAKEIKRLISNSVERVEQGNALVDQAGATMTSVVEAIQKVSSIVGEISRATVEQSSNLAQIGQAVSQMDRTTQQNAALVEQSAVTAQALRQQTTELMRSVAVFTLDGSRQITQQASPA